MRLSIVAAVIAVSALGSAGAVADDSPLLQIVPYGGLRVGGGLEDLATGADRDLEEGGSLALALELRYDEGDDRFWQLWYSRQNSEIKDAGASLDVDVEYLHIGGTVPIDSAGRVHTYLAGGLGATRFSPSGAGLSQSTRFSGSLALGLAVPLSESFALRVEARGYLTAIQTDTSIFCRSDNGEGFCAIAASGSSLFQAELLAGFAFRF